jgi:hypothetical protein
MKNWQVAERLNGTKHYTSAYIVAHGLERIKRGKNPSLPFGPIRNPRKALRYAQQALDRIRQLDEVNSRMVHQFAESYTGQWRIDVNADKTPTVNTVVVHAQDPIIANGVYRAIVRHVKTIHGKGFDCLVLQGDTFLAKSDVFLLAADPNAFWLAKSHCSTIYRGAMDKVRRTMQLEGWKLFRQHSSKCQN